jgi:hypothetical protein
MFITYNFICNSTGVSWILYEFGESSTRDWGLKGYAVFVQQEVLFLVQRTLSSFQNVPVKDQIKS